MRGALLAGGEGTRLWPTTKVYAKSMTHVYDRPMIDFPLGTLRDMGCDSVVIVSSRRGLGLIAQHVGDGEAHGMDVTYRVQPEGTTIADPIKKLDISGVFPLMLGDCYYDPAPRRAFRPTLYWHQFPTAHEHSVWNPEDRTIVEKPAAQIGQRAVIAYYYDDRIYDFCEQFEADGSRLDIVDIHNFYRRQGATMEEYTGFFADLGTPDGLLRGALHEQERQNG